MNEEMITTIRIRSNIETTIIKQTGVGLAVRRKSVKRHGGSITTKNKPKQGTSFIAILPTKQNKEKTNYE